MKLKISLTLFVFTLHLACGNPKTEPRKATSGSTATSGAKESDDDQDILIRNTEPNSSFIDSTAAAVFSELKNSEVSTWCPKTNLIGPTTVGKGNSTIAACASIDGYLLTFVKTAKPAGNVLDGCKNLQADVKWFLPNATDITINNYMVGVTRPNSSAFHYPIVEALKLNGTKTFWHGVIPQTASFNMNISAITNRPVSLRVDYDLLRPESSLNNFLTPSSIANTKTFDAGNNTAPYFCMARADAPANTFVAPPAGSPIQVKGIIEKNGNQFRLRPSPIGKITHFYSSDGLSVVKSVVSKPTVTTITKTGNQFSFPYLYGENFVASLTSELNFIFDNRIATIVPVSEQQRVQLNNLAQTRSVAIIRGSFEQVQKMITLSSVVSLSTEKLPVLTFFSYCKAETKHFRSSKQGCVFLPDPEKSDGFVIFGNEASRLTGSNAELQNPPEALDFISRDFINGTQIINNAQTATIKAVRDDIGSVRFDYLPASPCANGSCLLTRVVPGRTVPFKSGQTVDQIFGQSSKDIVQPAQPVIALKALKNYSKFFPANAVPTGFNFSFGQYESEITQMNAVGLEVAAALTAPKQKGTTEKYAISAFELNPKRRVLIGQRQGTMSRNGEYVATVLPIVFPERNSSLSNDMGIFATELFTSFELEVPSFPAGIPAGVARLISRDFSGDKISEDFGPYQIRFERGICGKRAREVIDGIQLVPASAGETCYAIGVRNAKPFPFDVTAGNTFTTSPGIASVIVSDSFKADIFGETAENCVFYKQNTKGIYDVNNDGIVSAADSLVIINELSRTKRNGGPTRLADGSCPAAKLYDVDGNGSLTSNDSLRVINELSRRNRAK